MFSATVSGGMAQAQSVLSYDFADGAVLTAYGQINSAYLGYDDGQKSQGYSPVGNSNSTPRFGTTYTTTFGEGWDFLLQGEAGYNPRPSDKINQIDGDTTDWSLTRSNIRKLEVMFGNDRYGKFWLGQGSMASHGISEIDMSGTTVIGYSNTPDTAGGFYFRQKDGTLSNTTIKNAETNLNGSRRLRVRYDTPSVKGFTLSGGYGNDWVNDNPDNDYADVALRHKGEFGGIETEAGVGYNWVMPDNGGNSEFWSGSVSGLHVATGLNLTLAGGSRVDRDGDYIYTKLGWKAKFWDFGSTNFAVDYYDGNGFTNSNTISDGESTTYSVMAVQTVEKYKVDVYAIYRVYTYDDNRASYDDGAAVMSGIRWRF